ncbi:hypothetical protein LVD17_23535 [Fulvivirga ulvae]|uniref:hypothetical protein n=1 Tax=Fulvivirga ulvae TaxID=2904245 RepID=UPI001F26F3E2|nr:hypothetical protein [Fulvivirga ulvae]UII31268.1 hypothetical protein LVD17_23535 [Fulvivirga ulvae]
MPHRLKSLYSIIKNLSDKEARAFQRLFLSKKRGGENKKRQLFEAALKSKRHTDFRQFVRAQKYSRQNYYQLSKRLRESLYDFLLSFHQTKRDGDRFCEEMTCHKKLYCVKILLDRGMEDHARQMLEEVLIISEKEHLTVIHYEAIDLQNRYFPFEAPSAHTTCGYIKSLNSDLSINEYLKQYLIESVMKDHNSDHGLRGSLIQFIIKEQLPVSDVSFIRELHEINGLFHQRLFEVASLRLKSLFEKLSESSDPNGVCLGLTSLELAKASVCTRSFDEASGFLIIAEKYLEHTQLWQSIIYELKYIIALRTFNTKEQNRLLHEVKQTLVTYDKEVFEGKWGYYTAYYYYQKGEFKEVIKLANSRIANTIKDQRELLMLKMLELICIYRLNDQDWFFYKSECLRKQLNGKIDKSDRLQMFFSIFRKPFDNSSGENLMLKKLKMLEDISPWHPLSKELLSFSGILSSLITVFEPEHLVDSE